MKLSTLSILLGLAVAAPNVYGVLKPKAFGEALRRFPRSTGWGYALVLLATFWFVWNLSHESIADFESLKPALYALFIAVGIGTCVFVQDFIAVRGLALVLLLMAKLMVDSARWAPSHFRLVIVTWAYIWVVAGVWFTVSPWRLRDLVYWKTANEKRTQALSAVRLGFGLFVAILGFTVF